MYGYMLINDNKFAFKVNANHFKLYLQALDCYHMNKSKHKNVLVKVEDYYINGKFIYCKKLSIVKKFTWDEFKLLLTGEILTNKSCSSYVKGMLHGPRTFFDEKGDVKIHEVFNQGNIIEKNYYKEGKFVKKKIKNNNTATV